MSWRIRITNDPFLYAEESIYDYVIYAIADVWKLDDFARSLVWQDWVRIYAPSENDPRFHELIAFWADNKFDPYEVDAYAHCCLELRA